MPDSNVCYYLNSQYHNYYITKNCYVYIISKKMVLFTQYPAQQIQIPCYFRQKW